MSYRARTALHFTFSGQEQVVPSGSRLRRGDAWKAHNIGDRNAMRALIEWARAELPDVRLQAVHVKGVARLAVIGETIEASGGSRKARGRLFRSS